MFGRRRESNLQRELRVTDDLERWVRDEIYRVRAGGRRASATTAIAASAAEKTFRIVEDLPDLQNQTSTLWHAHLDRVWEYLGGDDAQHYAISGALAEFLSSPLNHNEGQDGPDDFDRPQTVAAYSAALAAIAWGVDFATTAVAQIFESIDQKYAGDLGSEERWVEVQREVDSVRRVVTMVVESAKLPGARFTPELLAAIRS
ncbi:hypothetical protein [Nocardioides marmorisolisilvae]|uniref:Uncharacterized protein n=1 Tax=Nocardioides marmorisolisilvae TaxID=1542737 RepID=A0A3N0DIK0_9ACTN|nr:hypothetical protein [Nocardioides marmorisolisilvae]RNL75485.1 hypothetical protein EFL95_18950 [Nocardioides marmorisolisilvae]